MVAPLSEREEKILELLRERAYSVNEIAEICSVSKVTIRTDLSDLEEKGLIIRSRGGAFPAFHPDILEAQKRAVEEKRRIATAAAEMIDQGDTLMLNDGTTTSQVVRYLLGKRDIQIVTNNSLVLPYARVNPSLRVTVVGGEFSPSSEGMVGPLALRDLDQFYCSYAFIGTTGFSAEEGLTTHFSEGAEIIRKMVERSERIVLLADSGKYGKNGFVKILPMERVDILVTDTGLDNEVADRMADLDIKVLRV